MLTSIAAGNDVLSTVWYIDSGCSKHMTHNKHLLSCFQAKEGHKVVFGDNSYGLTKGVGTLIVGDVHITEVYYVEGLKHNLLSVSQFCDKGLLVPW